jgi:presenilin-like A22 family membrane protease
LALRVIEYRQLIQIISLFMIVQFAALLLATQVLTGTTSIELSSAQVTGTSNPLFYLLYLVSYVAILSLVMLFILKIYKGDKLFTLIEILFLLFGSFIFFLLIISSIEGNAFANLFNGASIIVYAASAILAVGLVVAKYKMPKLRNVAALIASIGVGVFLGLALGFYIALLFMAVIAVYDFIAVFVTKHMVAMGNIAINNNLSLLVMVNEVEAVPVKMLSASQKKEFEASKKDTSTPNSPIAQKIMDENMVPFAARTALGNGDFILPIVVAIAAYRVSLNFVLSFVVIIGAIFGLILTMSILRKYKRALPAIPPLLFGIVATLSVYFLFVHFV